MLKHGNNLLRFELQEDFPSMRPARKRNLEGSIESSIIMITIVTK